MQPGLFSVVIPALNEGTLLAMTTNSVLTQTRYPNYEIVVVDDGSTDGSVDFYERYPNPYIRVVRTQGQGVARARNLGAEHARGEFVVFLDAHCRVKPDWLDRFAHLLAIPDVAMVGPCFTKLEGPSPRGCGVFWASENLEQHWYEPQGIDEPYVAPFTIGACQAFRRSVFLSLGRYEDGFTRWGSEDVEICLRAWLLGYRVVVDPLNTVAHYFRESRAYDVDEVEVTYNFLRMVHLHFSGDRIEQTIAALGNNPHIVPAIERLRETNILELRNRMEARRIHNDDWFFRCVNRRP